jgi:hypothetical protein
MVKTTSGKSMQRPNILTNDLYSIALARAAKLQKETEVHFNAQEDESLAAVGAGNVTHAPAGRLTEGRRDRPRRSHPCSPWGPRSTAL